MLRMLSLCAVLGLTSSLVGCVYHPGGYDPNSGLMYGGSLRPMCGGPLDPFCAWCDRCFDTCPTNCSCISGPCMDCRDYGACPTQPPIVMPACPPTGYGAAACPTCGPHGTPVPMTYGEPYSLEYQYPAQFTPQMTSMPVHEMPGMQPAIITTPDAQAVPNPQPPMMQQQPAGPMPAPPVEPMSAAIPAGESFQAPGRAAYSRPLVQQRESKGWSATGH